MTMWEEGGKGRRCSRETEKQSERCKKQSGEDIEPRKKKTPRREDPN